MRTLLIILLISLIPILQSWAQTINAGDLMFVGYNADGDRGIAFITLIDLPDTTIYFTDKEWNGSAIGTGGAFTAGEGSLSWSSGGSISAGTVIIINQTATTSSVGTVTMSGTFNARDQNEVIYMYLGNNATDPILLISAIANDGFSDALGPLTNTGLTAGVNAIDIRTDIGLRDEDVMVFDCNCAGNVPSNAAAIADGNNWVTQDGDGDQHNDGTYPDFPRDICREKRTYYSLATGAWENNTSWSYASDGSSGVVPSGEFPRRFDNVVIRNGHTITINALNDNGCGGVIPDNMGRSNVGNSFNDSNDSYLYQVGDIIIENGATLSSTIRFMVEGYTRVEGALNVGSDMVNLGYLEVTTMGVIGGQPASDIDLTLSGSSTTIINGTANSDGTNTNFDDLNIDHTEATLCGIGLDLTEGSPSVVRFSNSASAAQICSDMQITCTAAGGCGNGDGTNNQGNIDISSPLGGTGPRLIGSMGPGGVGGTDGTSPLVLWLDAGRDVYSDAGVTASTDGGIIQQWNDQSGSGNHAIQTTGANQPQMDGTDPAINNAASVEFSIAGSTYMDMNSLTLDPATTSYSITGALNCSCSGNNDKIILQQNDGTGTGRSHFLYAESNDRFASDLGGSSGTSTTSDTKGNWTIYSTAFDFNGGSSTTISFHKTGTADGGRTVTPESSDGPWRLGAGKSATNFFDGPISEVAVFSQDLNDVQRILIENYLSAKYNIGLSAGDIYTMDNSGYDFDAAGIGQDGTGSSHRDATGTGVVRIWNPGDLNNNEYLMWGHDNGAMGGTTSDIDGAVIQERLQRSWAVSETGEVGTVSTSFDLNALASPLGSNLRLMIDRDGDGFADNDVSPITGSAIGGIVIFSGVNLQNGDRFTLGNTDALMPLPINLLTFMAEVKNGTVALSWSTASEINNDYFTLERSLDLHHWYKIATVDGAGNSESVLYYQETDLSPHAGVSYYRLKQTDFDGTFEYFDVAKVIVDKGNFLRIYPNPSDNYFTISTGYDLQPEQVEVYNTFGVKMPVATSKANGNTILDAAHYPPGNYIIQIVLGHKTMSRRVMKVR